jgi:hypothetical protein
MRPLTAPEWMGVAALLLEMIVVVFCNPELGEKIPFWTLSTLNSLVA